VVVSIAPRSDDKDARERRALFIGLVKDWADLDDLIAKYNVRMCLIAPQPKPHLVQKWAATYRDREVQLVIYANAGLSEPRWEAPGSAGSGPGSPKAGRGGGAGGHAGRRSRG
jgi:hypothetical protein